MLARLFLTGRAPFSPAVHAGVGPSRRPRRFLTALVLAALCFLLQPPAKIPAAQQAEEFIARREQRRIAELLGQLEWDESFDHKAERSRK